MSVEFTHIVEHGTRSHSLRSNYLILPSSKRQFHHFAALAKFQLDKPFKLINHSPSHPNPNYIALLHQISTLILPLRNSQTSTLVTS